MWQVSSDQTIGGTSTAQFVPNESGTGGVFQGSLSLVRNGERSKKLRGYSRAGAEELRDCEDYEGLGLGSAPTTTVHAQSDGPSFFPDDLHQGYIKMDDEHQESG